jgi:hypothetical protein
LFELALIAIYNLYTKIVTQLWHEKMLNEILQIILEALSLGFFSQGPIVLHC